MNRPHSRCVCVANAKENRSRRREGEREKVKPRQQLAVNYLAAAGSDRRWVARLQAEV